MKLEVIRDEEISCESEEDERTSEAALRQNGVDVNARHFRLTGDDFNKHSDRDVRVDFINSMEICGKECIRDKNGTNSHDTGPPTALSKLEKSR
jgi:hypothetical protein